MNLRQENGRVVEELSTTEARAGRTTGHMRWVLGISLSLAAIALAAAFAIYRL